MYLAYNCIDYTDVTMFTFDGMRVGFERSGRENAANLLPNKIKKERWINLYTVGSEVDVGCAPLTKEKAVEIGRERASTYKATFKIEWEEEE